MAEVTVRDANGSDAPRIAAVHVASWQETYRGQVPDHILDDLHFVPRREAFWTGVIVASGEGAGLVSVAERDGEIIGIASSGKPRDDDANWSSELYVLYVLADSHGSGAGPLLLDSVLGDESASLWVANPNPRAQAFYRKQGFVADGAVKNDGIDEIRMIRAASKRN